MTILPLRNPYTDISVAQQPQPQSLLQPQPLLLPLLPQHAHRTMRRMMIPQQLLPPNKPLLHISESSWNCLIDDVFISYTLYYALSGDGWHIYYRMSASNALVVWKKCWQTLNTYGNITNCGRLRQSSGPARSKCSKSPDDIWVFSVKWPLTI